MDEEIRKYVENHFKIIVGQTESYMPFIKFAFPYSNNLAESCFSTIVGNALSVFLNQYALRMKYPSNADFEEFGKLAMKYREQVEKYFK